MNKKMKTLAATVLMGLSLMGLGVAANEVNPLKVGAEVGYTCDGGSYEPVTNLNNSALKAALSEDGFESLIGKFFLRLKQLPKAKEPGTLSDYFKTTVDANISGERAYKLDDNCIIIESGKNTGFVTITFNQPVIRVVAQIAVVNNEKDVDNLNYTTCIYPVSNNSIKIDVAKDFPNCKYVVIGKLTFRLPA